MKLLCLRIAFGLITGAIAGLLAFVTIAVLFFAAGQYGSGNIPDSAIFGIIIGSMFGPFFFVRQTPWWKAASWESGIVCIAWLCIRLWGILTWQEWAISPEAFTSLLRSTISVGFSTTLAGVGTAWLTSRLSPYVTMIASKKSVQSHRASFAADQERRYRL